ncbi:type II secretion system protein GspK [uncultured Thiodictyon sp.]|uniref:general secretion pathway protein GspK n=1 Tax=uncultured Thiodictyon sp. TaxID=1846217 RepID=UPI0025DA0BCC|nr:type II secretion system protein GspK [uncultured Thiodictyon sp.]
MAGPDRPPIRSARLTQTARGIALVLVLWVLALLTVIAMGMTAAQRTETALTENVIADARFRALAEAAIVFTVGTFLTPVVPGDVGLGSGGPPGGPDTADWVPNGAPRTWVFDGNALRITVSNEKSRINLNQATAPVLSALLIALGVAEQEAAAIAEAIVDWRDEDDLKGLNGAEDQDYADAGRSLGAKDAPFVAVEELQQVLGVSRAIYQRLAPEVTVDTQDDQVDQTFASAAVLAALQGITLDGAQLQVQSRDAPALPGGQGANAGNRGGPLYRIEVKEQGAAGTARAMEALVDVAIPTNPVRWRRFGLVAGPPPAG